MAKVNMDKLAELDSHWYEVMGLAVKYGFVTWAYAGRATLMTHKHQLGILEAEGYIKRQHDMNCIDMEAQE